MRLKEIGTHEFELDEAMQPVPFSDIIYHEPVLMVVRGNDPPEGKLLFPPEEVLSVRSPGLDKIYEEGVDWEYVDGFLRLHPGSDAPFLAERDLLFREEIAGESMPCTDGGFLRFREGSFFHQHQVAVTYRPPVRAWGGPVPAPNTGLLPISIRNLKGASPFKLLLYGDSISEGCNSSGFTNTPPYLPIWGKLAASKMERAFGRPVDFVNTSLGGMDSAWGRENARERVCDYEPDLVALGFGMNDGTAHVPAAEYIRNLRSIMGTVRRSKPDTEFVLISTMLPNPKSAFWGTQPDFEPALLGEETVGAAVLNMTQVHRYLLTRKQYWDLTGNNINHPNDFMARLYAQFFCALFGIC